MKNLYFLLFACILFSSIAMAQTPQYHWMNQLGGVDDDFGGYIAVDGKGNVYTATNISLNASFKPRSSKKFDFIKTTTAATKNLAITKVDAVGNLIWAKQIESVSGVTTISVDKNNNLILGGVYLNTVDFDPGSSVFNLTAKNGGDIFILKLDENGNFLWAGSIGGKNGDFPYSIVTDKNNNIALICQFNDTIDVDMSSTGVYNLIASSIMERAVLKLSETGKFLWAHHLKDITPNALSFDSSGNLYSTGYFTGTKDFDFGSGVFNMTTTGAATSGDCYVLKVDTAGKFLWAKSFGEFINKTIP